MRIRFVIFVIICTLLFAAISSASVSIIFAATCEFSKDKTMAYCTVNTGLPNERVYFCTKNGTWHCSYVESPGSSSPPPSLSDAIVKADSVKPDLKGGNTTKVPKDLGSLDNDENGPAVNPGSD